MRTKLGSRHYSILAGHRLHHRLGTCDRPLPEYGYAQYSRYQRGDEDGDFRGGEIRRIGKCLARDKQRHGETNACERAPAGR